MTLQVTWQALFTGALAICHCAKLQFGPATCKILASLGHGEDPYPCRDFSLVHQASAHDHGSRDSVHLLIDLHALYTRAFGHSVCSHGYLSVPAQAT